MAAIKVLQTAFSNAYIEWKLCHFYSTLKFVYVGLINNKPGDRLQNKGAILPV